MFTCIVRMFVGNDNDDTVSEAGSESKKKPLKAKLSDAKRIKRTSSSKSKVTSERYSTKYVVYHLTNLYIFFLIVYFNL